jgi:hypothetical protein
VKKKPKLKKENNELKLKRQVKDLKSKLKTANLTIKQKDIQIFTLRMIIDHPQTPEEIDNIDRPWRDDDVILNFRKG